MIDRDHDIRQWAEKQIARMFPKVQDEEIIAALVGSLIVQTKTFAQHFGDSRDEDGRVVDCGVVRD